MSTAAEPVGLLIAGLSFCSPDPSDTIAILRLNPATWTRPRANYDLHQQCRVKRLYGLPVALPHGADDVVEPRSMTELVRRDC